MSNGTLPPLAGTWAKVNAPACADKYPDTLTFAGGTYRGTRGANQGFVYWDAGTYRLEADRSLALTTATDELIQYEVELAGDTLTIRDPDGCVFAYRRTSAPP
jgi:hypothetical protein